jgi:hypothetical protein
VKRPIERVGHFLTLIILAFPDFEDDGLSCFPDWIYRYILRHNITPAGRVHDWAYCSRCHAKDSMTLENRLRADRGLRQHARELLHWHFRITPWILYRGVRWFGGRSWDSCGPGEGEKCRHSVLRPVWMFNLD